ERGAERADVERPFQEHRERDVVSRSAGGDLLQEPEPLLGEREGEIPLARRLRTRNERRQLLRAPGFQQPRQSGRGRMLEERAQRQFTANACRTRETTCIASSEWPPRAKKSPSAPTGPPARTSSQIPASTSSAGVRGAR